jgi:ribosomal protein S18 acetylase RimI-like enzyme
LANRVQARGFGEVIRLGNDRLKENIRSDETLIFYVRGTESVEAPALDLHGRPASPGDAGRYALDVGTDSPVTFQDRLGDDRLCYVVEEGGKLLHASWVATSPVWTRELRRPLAPPPGAAYVYESFTHPDARGRGVYPFALRGIVTTMADRGIQQVWVAVEASNQRSQRAVTKAGFEPAFTLSYRRRLGRLSIDSPGGNHPDLAGGFL